MSQCSKLRVETLMKIWKARGQREYACEAVLHRLPPLGLPLLSSPPRRSTWRERA